MAGTRIDTELLYRVATAYYIEKRQQREIADDLQVSRVQVCKYLKMAEEKGLVRIEIVPPSVDEDEQRRFRQEFRRLFGTRDVLVCPSYSSSDNLLTSLVRQAEKYLWDTFGTGALVVGLGWGRTMLSLAESVQKVDRRNWHIVPLAGGNIRASEKHYNINYLVQTLAEKIGAQSLPVYLPLIFDNRAGHQRLVESSEFQHISAQWDNLDLLVCSIGSQLAGSPLFKFETNDPSHLENLQRAHAVGDMLTHFYDIQGRVVELGIEDRMINISRDQLMRAKERLVVVSGVEKADAILGALRAHFVDRLVIDHSTATEVLKRERSTRTGGDRLAAKGAGGPAGPAPRGTGRRR